MKPQPNHNKATTGGKKMAVLRDRPYPGVNFLVDLGDGDDAGPESGVYEVIFPEARMHLLEYRSGNDKESQPRTLQTLTRYGNLVLRRGVIGSLAWYQWWNALRNQEQAIRNITVKLLSEDRSNVVLTWRFIRARPVNYQVSPLNGLGLEPLVENLEIAFERFEME
jgi:phage tail-like protein